MKTELEIKIFVESVIAPFLRGDPKNAFDKIRPYWNPADLSKVSATEKLYPVTLFPALGKGMATEKIKDCKVGTFLMDSYYAVKFANSYYIWSFKFYNPGDGWQLRSFVIKPERDFTSTGDVCKT